MFYYGIYILHGNINNRHRRVQINYLHAIMTIFYSMCAYKLPERRIIVGYCRNERVMDVIYSILIKSIEQLFKEKS